MAEMVWVCSESDLPREGQVSEITNRRLCIARMNGKIYVMDNDCPHNGAPLGRGMLEDGRVVCPFHGWAFDVKTGEALHNPAGKVQTYVCEIRDGALMVQPPDRRT